MEDMYVQDDVKDEVTLLEYNRKQVFWQRILIHNQWLKKNNTIILRKLYCGNTLDYKKMLDTMNKNLVTLGPLVVPSTINAPVFIWGNTVYTRIITSHEVSGGLFGGGPISINYSMQKK